jgi:hypothetical protein
MRNNYIKEFIIIFLSTLVIFSGLQSYSRKIQSLNGNLYLLIHLIVLVFLVVFILKSWKQKALVYRIVDKVRLLEIPKKAKLVILLVFIGNFVSIGLGTSRYPFYDVGMFRWTIIFKDEPKIVYKPKYYYYDKVGKVKVLDLRKEGFLLLAEHFGWLGYNHEFTFSSTFHNKGQKENYEFIAKELKKEKVDTLWVGIHWVNYETGEVGFDPDICNAIEINSTKEIHYGPIYIPEYQLDKCKI